MVFLFKFDDMVLSILRKIMKIIKTIGLAVTLVASSGANAFDLGNALNTVNEVSKTVNQLQVAPTPTPVQQPATPESQITTTSSVPSTNPESDGCSSSDIAFKCKIKGKELVYCNHFSQDDPEIMVTIGYDKNTNNRDLLFITNSKNLLNISEEVDAKSTVTTAYFTQNGSTYGISTCNGMGCFVQSTLFTEIKGSKIINETFCDPDTESESGFKFPVSYDKKYQLKSDEKSSVAIKKSKIYFDIFNRNQASKM